MIKFSGQSKFFPLQQVSTCAVSLREKLSHQNFGIYSHMLCVSLIIYHYSSVRGTLHELLSQKSYRYTRNLRMCRGGVGSCSVCDNFENARFCVVKIHVQSWLLCSWNISTNQTDVNGLRTGHKEHFATNSELEFKMVRKSYVFDWSASKYLRNSSRYSRLFYKKSSLKLQFPVQHQAP